MSGGWWHLARFQLTREQVVYGLEKVQLRATSIFDECPYKDKEARQQVTIFL